MEWLEFTRWSPEVEQHLLAQVSRLGALARPQPVSVKPQGLQPLAERLKAALEGFPRTNPWGHPPADC
jgi:hypothetical protein